MTFKVIDGLDLNLQQVKNVADGSLATDAATWGQVQNMLAGLAWKPSVRTASTSNVTLASPGATIGGVTMAAGDRVLLMGQTSGAENGLYVWSGAGAALARAADMDTAAEAKAATTLVTEGTFADTAWTQTADNVTLGTTTLVWAQFGAGSSYQPGNGLQLSGNTFSVKPVAGGGIVVSASGVAVDTTVVARKYAANVGDGTSTSIVVNHQLGSTDVTYSLKDTSSNDFVLMKATTVDANNIRFVFPTAPASGAYRVTVTG